MPCLKRIDKKDSAFLALPKEMYEINEKKIETQKVKDHANSLEKKLRVGTFNLQLLPENAVHFPDETTVII